MTWILYPSVPGFDVKANFGAYANAIRGFDGAVTGTAFTSASASFVAGDVGKSIGIVGAGTAGVNHITTIAAFVSATAVTLTVTAPTSVSSKQYVYGHDDTPAFQSAINAAATASGGLIRVPPGQYFIAGAIQDTSAANSQIKFPNITDGQPEYIIELRGDYSPMGGYWNSATGLQVGGAVLHTMAYSTTTGWSGPSVFGGGSNGNSFGYSWVGMRFTNICIRAYPDPHIDAINGNNIAFLDVGDILIDTGVSNILGISSAPSASYGILFPPNDHSGPQIGRGIINITGFNTGVRVSEHVHLNDLQTYVCTYGLECAGGYHSTSISKFLVTLCKTAIKVSDTSACSIANMDVEHKTSGGAWNSTGYEVDDSGNKLSAVINWWTVLSGTGPDSNFRVNGGSNLKLTEL